MTNDNNQNNTFKNKLLKSVLGIKEHMNELREETFNNAIGGNNENADAIANEFRKSWDESEELRKQITIVKSIKPISNIQKISQDKGLDFLHSDAVMNAINSDIELPEIKLLETGKEKNKFDFETLTIGSIRDGSIYLALSMATLPVFYAFFSEVVKFDTSNSFKASIAIFITGVGIAYFKSFENILSIKKRP
jgi:hypothetical protein